MESLLYSIVFLGAFILLVVLYLALLVLSFIWERIDRLTYYYKQRNK